MSVSTIAPDEWRNDVSNEAGSLNFSAFAPGETAAVPSGVPPSDAVSEPWPADSTTRLTTPSAGETWMRSGPYTDIVGTVVNVDASIGVPYWVAGAGGAAEVAGVEKSTESVPVTVKLSPSTRLVFGSAR